LKHRPTPRSTAPPRDCGTGACVSRRRRMTSGFGLIVMICIVMLSSCDSSDTVLGACVIQPGVQCKGNYMAGADLRGANLYGANLHRADLTGADLSRANLAGSDLRHAKIRNAQLEFADLEGSNLINADLRNSNLLGARLDYANLTGARVGRNTLAGVHMCDTILSDGSVANPGCSPYDRVIAAGYCDADARGPLYLSMRAVTARLLRSGRSPGCVTRRVRRGCSLGNGG